MATLTLSDGRSFEIARFKLGALRRAAPHIDAINASVQAAAEGDASFEAMFGPVEHVVAVVAIGLEKIDPALTADALLDQLEFADMAALGNAMRDILQEAGLAPSGEASAPTAPETETVGASPSSSTDSSAS